MFSPSEDICGKKSPDEGNDARGHFLHVCTVFCGSGGILRDKVLLQNRSILCHLYIQVYGAHLDGHLDGECGSDDAESHKGRIGPEHHRKKRLLDKHKAEEASK